MRKPLEKGMKVQEVLMLLTEGNPGAAVVLVEMLNLDLKNLELFKELVTMNIRGPQVWVGFKDHCNQDLYKFIDCVKKHDPEMIATINKLCGDPEAIYDLQ